MDTLTRYERILPRLGADAHEAHAHEEHAHEAHAHEDHGHDEHWHHEHLDPPCVPQPSRAEAREALWKEINEKDEASRKERAEKVAAAAKKREETPQEAGIFNGYRLISVIVGILLAIVFGKASPNI